LVVNGNLLFSRELGEILLVHRQRRADATIGVISRSSGKNGRPQRERMQIGPQGDLLRLQVEYDPDAVVGDYQPAGVYVFEREVLKRIPAESYCDLKEQFIPALLRAGLRVGTHPIRGYLHELNSAEDYLKAQFDLCRGHLGGPQPGREIDDRIWVQGEVDLPPDVFLVGPIVLGAGVKVGPGARLIGPLVVGDGAEIGAGALLRESVVGERASLGRGARVEHAILTEGMQVEEGSVITESLATAQPLSLGAVNLTERDMRISVTSIPFERFVGVGLRSFFYRVTKRLFDVTLATIGLVLGLPLMAVVALAIRVDSPGPVLFRQRRCGKGGREFTMVKFRSMRWGAEELQDSLSVRNETDGPVFKMTDDPRFTRLGSVLRKFSLDELPQLWNVLKGEMSIVGPRPLAERELKVCPSWREARLRVKPGVTGLWQVSSREKKAFRDWVQQDLRYVRNQSFSFDMKILLRTIGALTKGL
jgi:lipopolysaccharide/colanic/teichoic acid biosynthesis glycosyltransferase